MDWLIQYLYGVFGTLLDYGPYNTTLFEVVSTLH